MGWSEPFARAWPIDAIVAEVQGHRTARHVVLTGGEPMIAKDVRVLAKEIKALIGASVQRVEHGTTLVDQAGATMTEVVRSSARVVSGSMPFSAR